MDGTSSRPTTAGDLTMTYAIPVYSAASSNNESSPTAPSSSSAPYPIGTGIGSNNAPTGTAPRTTATASGTLSSHASTTTAPPQNGTCGGATLNVLSASLDWWYTRTLEHVVSTLSIQFSPNDSQTGWTLLPATTTFDVSSALEESSCVPTSTGYDTVYNQTTTEWGCFTIPPPVAAETSLVTIDAVKSINATTGNGTSLPHLVTVPPTPAITIPSAAGTFSAGTPFVYFSSYEIMSSRPTQAANGSIGCETVTRAFKMSVPFSFNYTGESVDGQLLVGEDVVGDVNPLFLGLVNAPSTVSAGSWVAAPTVVIVVQKTVQAQAVLAKHTEGPQSGLQTPSATLPSGLTPLPPTSQPAPGPPIPPTGRIEVTQPNLQVPTPTVRTNGNAAVGAPSPNVISSEQPLSAITFLASDVTLVVSVPATQRVVTAVAGGTTYTATAAGVAPTPGGENGRGGIGGLISAVASAVQPSNALDVLSQALVSLTNPTASAIVAGLGGPISPGGSGSSGSGAQPDRLLASPAPVITFGGATITGSPTPAVVVGGQTAFAGGAPITVSGTVISVAASGNAVVVGGSTVPFVASGASSSAFAANGVVITAAPVAGFQIGGQTLKAGGPAITVDGTTVSLAPGGTALIVDGSTSAVGAAASIPLLTIGSKVFTANAATQFYIAPGQTLTPGGIAVVDGTTISLASDASAVMFNGLTRGLSAAIITPAPTINFGGTAYSPNAGTMYHVDGKMLTPGGVITVSGSTISLGQGASYVVINGQTSIFSSTTARNPYSPAITAPPILTVDGLAIAPNGGGSYLISGQVLTPGGAVTFSGPNGMETVSLDASGTALVDIISGVTATSLIASAGGIAATAAPVLTIGGQTFTAIHGGAADPTYIINGQTLTAGELETVTLGVSTYIISLSSMATILVIEQAGPGGVITATSVETLFPATNTRGTVYMTDTLPGETSKSVVNAAQTSAGSTLAPPAGLQNQAAGLPLQFTAILLGSATLLLAVAL